MCSSAPRACSEPGGQKPVLSLSLNRITQSIFKHSLCEWTLTSVIEIAILGGEMITIREIYNYPRSDICRKRQTCYVLASICSVSSVWNSRQNSCRSSCLASQIINMKFYKIIQKKSRSYSSVVGLALADLWIFKTLVSRNHKCKVIFL